MQTIRPHQKVTLAELAGVDFSNNFETFSTYQEPAVAELLRDLPKLTYKGEMVYISQSMLKAYRKVQLGQGCLLQFFHRYITKQYVDDNANDSIAKLAGRRFEYELTGALDRAGEVPPELLTPTRGVPSSEQKRITTNVELARKTLARFGFKMDQTQTGKTVTVEEGLTGTFDLLCERDGHNAIVDIKYSGLIGDKWNQLAWNDEHDTANHITRNWNHATQAIHYQLLEMCAANWFKTIDFYFVVFDNRKGHEGEYKIFEMHITDDHRRRHLYEIAAMIEDLQYLIETNTIKAQPNLKECGSCPVQNCSDRLKFEPVRVVVLE